MIKRDLLFSQSKHQIALVFTTVNFSVINNIIPRARMGSESIAYEAEGRMGYLLRGHEGERNNCCSKIQLVGLRYRE